MLRARPSRSVRLLAAGAAGVAVAALLPAASAQAATAPFTVEVKGGYNNATSLGNATGSVTASAQATRASYSVTLCGQNTYPNSTVTIRTGSARADHTVSYSNCHTFSGNLTSSTLFSTAQITVSGGTFYPGNQYTTYSKSRTVYF